MNGLRLYQDSIQALCNILRPLIHAEIMVIDRDLIAVAGTGPYRSNVGTRRPRDSYVHMSMMSGESYRIDTPKYTNQCLKCEIRSRCPYSSVISSPIKYGNEVFGIFGFLGYDAKQRHIMEARTLSLSKLSNDIADFLAGLFSTKHSLFDDLFGSEEMSRIINCVDEGIILTNRHNRIININQPAETALNLDRREFLGKDLRVLQKELGIHGIGPVQQREEEGKKARFHAFASPIRSDCPFGGRVIVFRSETESRRKGRRSSLNEPDSPELIGRSEPIQRLKSMIARLARSTSTVLITGETGSGKELAARRIHRESPRRQGPFVTVNCGAIPSSLFESELFGYTPGAFTGAKRGGKAGKFERADKGTLFLDEIGYLSLEGQTKILRFLEDSVLERVGGTQSRKLDVRIVAATNKDLRKMVEEGSFLEDLYYRLNVVPLHIPPLRERREDIPLLLEFFLRKTGERFGSRLRGFDLETLSFLVAYPWPGNVRELKNVVEYVCNVRTEGCVEITDLPPYLGERKAEGTPDTPGAVAQAERLLIEEAIRMFGDSTEGKKKAAKYLGISLTTLYRRLGKRPT